MKKISLPLAVIAATALIAVSAPAKDSREKEQEKIATQQAARAALARGEILPITRILGFAQRAAPGDVLEVELKRSRRVPFKYEVKTLGSSGRVREVELDARNGNILKVEDD